VLAPVVIDMAGIADFHGKVLGSINNINLELENKITFFERKYGLSYEEFGADVPDTVQGHDDWIEWTYLIKASEELSDKINKLSFLMGK